MLAGRDARLPGMMTFTPDSDAWPDSIPPLADLIKAYPPLEHAHTLLLWDADTLIKRMSPDGESDTKASAKSSTKAPAHHAAIPAGARWITVHPGGNKSAKGQPILVVPHPHKKGAYSVIGGAGGKLNYLKIRELKSDQDYKAEAGERHAAKKQLEQQRIAADKEAGIHTGKTAAKAAISAQTQEAQRNLIEHVARMAGWKEAETTFPAEKYQHLSTKAYAAMQAKHHAGLLKQARQFIDLHRQQTLADSDRRAEALGAIPLTASPDAPETLTVNDLDPVRPPDRGLGFNPDYRARAEAEAGGAEQLDMDVRTQRDDQATASGREPADPAAQQESAERRRDTAAELKAELEAQAPPPKPKVSLETAQLNTQQVIDLLAADKQLRNIEKQAREAKGKIDEAKTLDEAKAYNLTLGERPSGDEIVQDLKDQLKTGQTVAFLQRIEKAGSEDDLVRHVSAGAAAAANSVGLTLGGQALIDRSVIDVLGVSGAAQVIARQLHSQLSPEDLDDALAAMEAHHVETYTQRAEEAMSQADAWDELADIDSPDADSVTDGHGIAAVESLNRQRIEALAESRRVLGSALGEFEMNAAIIMALKEGRPDRNFEVSLGAVTPEAAIVQLRALGLAPEQFKLDKIGDQQFATVTAGGLDRIARPVDRDTLTRLRTAQDIIDGHQDEDNWLPSGVAKRPDLAMESQPGQAPKIAEPFAPAHADDVQRGLEDYIGGRTADGDAPADILADLLSLPMMEKAEAAGGTKDSYMAAVNRIAPSRDADNKLIRAEAHVEKFQALADQFVQRRYGNSRSPLHRQDMPLDDKTTDSLHRALSAHPAGVAGFKAIGDLTPQDQAALRQHFEKHVAKASTEAEVMKADLEKLDSNEPEKETEDMFGETSVNPAWQDWQNRRNDLAEQVNAATLDWGKYVKMMGGRKKAYATIQDLIRSDVCQTFADSYNTLNPQAPLKVGRQVVRGNLQHLDAIDPVAREARLSQERKLIDGLRNRSGGQYSAGSVVEKIEAARDQQEASAQSQMGFFGDPEPVADTPPEPLKTDERHTLGHVIEQRLAGLCNTVGHNFKPGQAPVKLFNLNMSGKYKNQQRAVKLILENKRVALAQGVGCVDGGTILDDADSRQWTFYQWWLSGERPLVRALTEDGKEVCRAASPVFIKGFEPMYRVQLTNGALITVTGQHRFLTPSGWKKTDDLHTGEQLKAETIRPQYPLASFADLASAPSLSGDALLTTADAKEYCEALPDECALSLPQTIADNARSIHLVDDRRSLNKAPDCLDHYFSDCRQGDELLLTEAMDALAFAPLPTDALEYSRHYLSQDDQEDESGYSHAYPRFARHSSRDFFHHDERLDCDEKCCIFSYTSSPFLEKHLSDQKSQPYSGFDRDIDSQLFLDQGDAVSRLAFWQPDPNPALHLQPFDGSRLFQRQFLQSTDSVRRLQQCADDHISWQEISSITSVGSRIVFDVHVPINHCYFANGILNHNSGKSVIGLGAFAELHAQGKVKKGVFCVPSIVQDQMHGEALRFLQAGQFKWSSGTGATRDERIAALKDPENHFSITTHQSLRDDLLHLGAQHAGMTEAALARHLDTQSPAQRQSWMKDLLAKEGINADYCFFDESHVLLNREGKENSAMANVLDSLSANASHYVNATADPVKNSVDEAFSLLEKMNPGKYNNRAEFMRRYGPDTRAAKDGLRRELLQHLYPGRIDPGVAAQKIEQRIDMNPDQHQAIADLDKAAGQIKLARIQGKAHVEAAKKLAPQMFKDAPEDQHEAIAKEVAKSAGVLKNAAVKAIIDRHPGGAKQQAIHQIIADRKGKPGVIFCHSLDAVHQLTEQLKAKGHRVVSMTGADSAQVKAQKKAQFNPDSGDASADIMVTSDAGAVGMNAQRGQWLVQYDTCDTAMCHAQRGGRIHRLGQKNDVELIDLIANHPSEDAARKRLASKYELRETITSPYEGLDDTGLAHHLQQRRAERLPKPEAEPVEYDMFGDPIPRQAAPVAEQDDQEDNPNDDQGGLF